MVNENSTWQRPDNKMAFIETVKHGRPCNMNMFMYYVSYVHFKYLYATYFTTQLEGALK